MPPVCISVSSHVAGAREAPAGPATAAVFVRSDVYVGVVPAAYAPDRHSQQGAIDTPTA